MNEAARLQTAGKPNTAALRARAAFSETSYILSMLNTVLLTTVAQAEFEAGDEKHRQALLRIAGEAAKSRIAFRARSAKDGLTRPDKDSTPGYA